MPNFETLAFALKQNNPEPNLELVKKAYDFSEKAHTGQKRKSGERYFDHPIEVATILAEHRMDEEIVATALLHDVVEDTLVNLDEIEKNFGKEISEMVDGVTKLSKVSFRSKDVRQSESFRKMLLAMAKDIRVIIVKLVDRLHNMRTLEHMSEMQQMQVAQETLDIYAPLANRLGISWLKIELEDLSFKFLRPIAYEKVKEQVFSSKIEHDKFIDRVKTMLKEKMQQENISCDVSGRRKHLYSLFKKMESRNLEYEQINDLLAFRIVVDTVPKCYEVLGYIHSLWKPVPGRFKDFIALPKGNLYRSLHTTVIGPQGERIEIQIRTKEMHEIAEEGIAAHWSYKSQNHAQKKEVEQFKWLRQMVEWQQDLPDSHEFIETVKIDLFAGEVYVFTPQGEVLEFPRGSTPVDFAFRVHSQVGEHCKGAKANGRMVPLKYKLQNGDTLEIITDKNSHPSKDWLKFVMTSSAKSKIRSYIKKQERDTAKTIGRDILIREYKKVHENFDSHSKSDLFQKEMVHMGYGSIEEILIDVGYGKLHPEQLIDKTISKDKPKSTLKRASKLVEKVTSAVIKKKEFSPIQVGGADGVLVRFGKCCSPIHGDNILGFVTLGRGITVHKTDCPKILETDNKRKIEVVWSTNTPTLRVAKIKILSSNKQGNLAKISEQITKQGGDVTNASIKTTQDEKAVLIFDINISNALQLNKLISEIQKIPGIISVERIKSLKE